jgi:hypothetical protein
LNWYCEHARINKQGKQLGKIIENPKPENMLEEEIIHIIQQA